ncbi:MAG: carbohydrate-binding domain-containing protein [Firmicutes bacterium]|nr:carbohydrate-binding domain-containing protein [Bacillota bacterium]
MKKKIYKFTAIISICALAAGCSGKTAMVSDSTDQTASVGNSAVSVSTEGMTGEITTANISPSANTYSTAKNSVGSTENTAANTSAAADTSELFSDRDLKQTADTSSAKTLTVSDGKTLSVTEEGVYVISGTAKNATIKVEASKDAKVQLVLDGVNIINDDFPAIYVVSADKCFVTLQGSNTLSVTGTFKADGDTNTDAVIYSKDDLVLNGTGTLNITSTQGNGVTGKDDLKVTGGTYNVTCAKDAFEAKDSIGISDGTFKVNTQKDAFHSEDSDDDTKGFIYISGGSFDINAASDGIQGTTYVQIDGGTYNITSAEGIEATFVQINDGTINISASDDGINASTKSKSYGTPKVEFNGGTTTIVMGRGDTDAVDANGDIIVNGGKIDVTAQTSSFDYDGKAEFNGGTIIINGEQVSEIPQPMMMGGGRDGMGGFGGQGNFGGQNGEMPEFNGERPDFGSGEMPEFNGERPDFGGMGGHGGHKGQRPDFDADNNTQNNSAL